MVRERAVNFAEQLIHVCTDGAQHAWTQLTGNTIARINDDLQWAREFDVRSDAIDIRLRNIAVFNGTRCRRNMQCIGRNAVVQISNRFAG